MSHNIVPTIKNRRSIFPNCYNQETISDEEILKIIEMASWAPTHRKTEPWKFIIFRNEGRKRLADQMVQLYLKHTPEEKRSEKKMDKLESKPLKAQAIITLVLETHPDLVPEWEEVASLAMGVQNMYLTCASMSIGCYWSSPSLANHLGPFLQLEENQKCLGLFYMGKYDEGMQFPERERTPS